jgi:SH3-like domain-containing protein
MIPLHMFRLARVFAMSHRLLIALLTTAGLLLARSWRAAEEYPYTAYVTADEVDVRSGPSTRHYMTHRLFAGDEVQVYRREATGWLAIRPPEGSYSWIPADVTEETNDRGVYRVLSEIAALIDSPDKSLKKMDCHQVKLRPGELVKVAGEVTHKTANGDEVWLKILPPDGEFRWIHIQQVSKSPPREQDIAAARLEQREPARNTPREYREVQAAVGTGVNRVKESLAAMSALNAARREKPTQPAIELRDLNAKPSESDVRPVEHQLPVNVTRDYNASPDGFVKRKPRPIENTAGVPAPSSDLRMASREQMQNSIHGPPRTSNFNDLPNKPALQPSGLPASPVKTNSVNNSVARDTGPSFDAATATEQLAKLDVELSVRVAQPRELWNLDAIRNQTQRIVDGGQTPAERGQARLLLEKIRRFEETFDMPNDPILAARSKSGTASAADARYDGVGLLQPVLARNGQLAVAQYALVDSDGNPLAFVTPGPGLNLRRYENKPVGIYGKRGLIEKLNKPHLVAERVIELSTR